MDRAREHVPLGEGLVVRTLRLAPPDVVRLGGILLGHDHLASIHGGRDEREVVLVTTEDRARELDAVLDELAAEIALVRVGDGGEP